MSAKYAFIDTETTGFDSLRNQVLTLACYITTDDYEILKEIYLEFKPEGKRSITWSEDAAKVHGISYEKAMGFPSIKDSISSFYSAIDEVAHGEPLTFVAHNCAYDRRMLKGTFSRYDEHFRLGAIFREYQDTVKLVRSSGLVSSKSKSLGNICSELGIEHNHHDARSDAFVLIEIHRRCKQGDNDSILTVRNSDSHTTPDEVFHV